MWRMLHLSRIKEFNKIQRIQDLLKCSEISIESGLF